MRLRRARNYQSKVIDFCLQTEHPALFLEQRLGKNLCVIRTLKKLLSRDDRVLIVTPTEAILDWYYELINEGYNDNDISLLTGTIEQRDINLHSNKKFFILNINGWFYVPEISKFNWHSIVLDESTAIKDPKTKTSKFFTKNFRDVKKRFILAGIPDPEDNLNYINQLIFLDPKKFGFNNYYKFRSQYCVPGSFKNWNLTKEGMKFLRNKISEMSIIMNRGEKFKSYKNYYIKSVQLPETIIEAYRVAEKYQWLEYEGAIKKNKHKIALFSSLRQLTSGFINDKLKHTCKLKMIKNILNSHDSKFIVFTSFKRDANLLYNKLKSKYNIGLYTGDINKKKRLDSVKEFKSSNLDGLICITESMTYGIDLSIADLIIYYCEPLSYLVKRQSEDRFINVKQKSNKYIYSILAMNTIDVDIHNGLKNKENRSSLSRSILMNIQKRNSEINL